MHVVVVVVVVDDDDDDDDDDVVLLLLLFFLQSVDLCLEWLRWGLGNRQRVGQAYGIKPLNCHRNPLVQNVASRGSAVQSDAFLPIAARKSCTSSARGPSVSTATGTNTWL